ncbi:tRNA pseudouridine synthase B [Streptococcus pneumoniae]|nr:tRNA pseudouridine synthase B [Streptococcus pneumoniae]
MNGIINLKKEAGMTSHDAVFKLRKILGTKKIGHGGTLDPDVVGVLPIAVGKATRMVEFMQDEGKIYEGEITLGYSTTTEDASGEVVAETPVLSPLDEKLVDEAIASLTGPITQIPPMYSAVKVNGRKLYEYARAGQEVERPERQVTIYQFERTSPISYDGQLARFTFRVKCSKGTYIRTLSVDLGEKLGYAAHMSHLTRTSAAGLQLEDALTLEEIAEKVEAGQLDFLHPLEIGTGDLVKVFLTLEDATEVRFGRFIELDQTDKELAAFEDDKLLAILENGAISISQGRFLARSFRNKNRVIDNNCLIKPHTK